MQHMNVYEIAPGRYALGTRGDLALAVIERVAPGPGRPYYRGIRGRRPVIDQRFKRVPASKISGLMRSELARVAKFN